ncbi:hypothetical protein CRUP_015967 [Coryphaenoides rupestris]|nr:hypothetical protein CRUP_015967 [Coryphaenoides rupestris]
MSLCSEELHHGGHAEVALPRPAAGSPVLDAPAVCRRLLLQSMWSLYSEEPSSPVEKMANRWIQSVLRQLATEESDAVTQILVEHAAVPPEQYHLRVLRKVFV